jgi:2-dehydro-3-deoxy-D-arabinonate dehydratase
VRPLPGVATIAQLLRSSAAEIEAACARIEEPAVELSGVRLLPPVDSRMEVWAAGVTYRRSRQARVQESDHAADVYELVYEATRPELFFKSAAWRVTGHGEQVSVRRDSDINVPEPELAVVLNADGEVVGYTICDDVSSRSIEGTNPLYLPQAKTYLGSCAVGPGIRPAWEVPDPYDLEIAMSIRRQGSVVWEASASTSELHRKLDDLAEHLFREDAFPDGVVLSTGTSLVPELPMTLMAGDSVHIRIELIGTLTSEVCRGKDHMGWLIDGRVRT